MQGDTGSIPGPGRSWTCCRATKPVNHNYWSPRAQEPVLLNKRSHCDEKPTHHNKEQCLRAKTRELVCSNKDSAQSKIKINKYVINTTFFKKEKKKRSANRTNSDSFTKTQLLNESGRESQKARLRGYATGTMPRLHHRFPLVKMPLFSIPGQGTPQFPPLMLSLDFYPTISSSTLTRLDAPQHLLLKAISFWAEASHEWVWLLGAYVTHLKYNCKGKANNWLLPWGRTYHKLGKFPNIKRCSQLPEATISNRYHIANKL